MNRKSEAGYHTCSDLSHHILYVTMECVFVLIQSLITRNPVERSKLQEIPFYVIKNFQLRSSFIGHVTNLSFQLIRTTHKRFSFVFVLDL